MSRIVDSGARWADRLHDAAVLALFAIAYAQTHTWAPRIALIVIYFAVSLAQGWILGSYTVLERRVLR